MKALQLKYLHLLIHVSDSTVMKAFPAGQPAQEVPP